MTLLKIKTKKLCQNGIFIGMKRLLFILIVFFTFGCRVITTPYYDDVYFSRPSPLRTQPYFYNPMYLNRYTPYNPYYNQYRIYFIPKTNEKPRVVEPHKQPKTNNAPIRKF
jgi:hypothetical protein